MTEPAQITKYATRVRVTAEQHAMHVPAMADMDDAILRVIELMAESNAATQQLHDMAIAASLADERVVAALAEVIAAEQARADADSPRNRWRRRSAPVSVTGATVTRCQHVAHRLSSPPIRLEGREGEQ